MDPTELKQKVIICVTLVGIAFIVLTALFPQFAFVFLSIEVLLLPAVYSYASERNEQIIRDDYNSLIEQISEESTELEAEYKKVILENESLKKELNHYKKRK